MLANKCPTCGQWAPHETFVKIAMEEPPRATAPAGAPSEEDVARLVRDTLISHVTSEPIDRVLTRKLMALLRREPKE